MLHPLDPVDQLLSKINFSTSWVTHHRPNALPALGRLTDFVWRRVGEIRAERPCLVHGDANLLNIIVGDDQVTLIDWDFPGVRYPIDELSALDEHAYLNGAEGLPAAFFDGYGRDIPRDLLLAYRMVGCLNWLSSDDWDQWAHDSTVPAPARNRLALWHDRLVEWVDQMPQLSDLLIVS
jgi:Phosphotransferase enzyme family